MIAPKAILFVKLRGIGDSVLSLPAVHALARRFSGARLTLLVPPASEGVFSQDRRVHEVLVYDRAAMRSPLAQGRLIRELRQRHFGLAFCPHASLRTGLIARLSGATWRSVRNHSGRDWFNNLPCPIPKEPKSILEREFDGLRGLGIQYPPGLPRMALGAAALAWAAQALPRGAGKTLLLASGGRTPERRWPAERFAALAFRLAKQKQRLAWLKVPGEKPPRLPRNVPVLSTVGVQQMGALLKRAGWVLGNNSGPRHVGAACGARSFTLFARDLPREWHPYPPGRGHWALRPPQGRLQDLEVGQVLRKVRAWLRHPEAE